MSVRHLTKFQEKVFEVVKKIPKGKIFLKVIQFMPIKELEVKDGYIFSPSK